MTTTSHPRKSGAEQRVTDTELLSKIQGHLQAKFGNEIQKVILYGSRSKGAATPYSDYDILVVLKHPHDWRMRRKISSACYDIDLKYDILTDVKTISMGELDSPRGRQPFITNALNEGISA